MIFVTLPKIYGGLQALGYVGTKQPVTATVIKRIQRDDRCVLKLKIAEQMVDHSWDCDEWAGINVSQKFTMHPVWILHHRLDEVPVHLLIDVILFLLEGGLILFLLLLPRLMKTILSDSTVEIPTLTYKKDIL
jgi:hypothetical protein